MGRACAGNDLEEKMDYRKLTKEYADWQRQEELADLEIGVWDNLEEYFKEKGIEIPFEMIQDLARAILASNTDKLYNTQALARAGGEEVNNGS